MALLNWKIKDRKKDRKYEFPHHKYFIRVVSKFFTQTDLFFIISNDHFKTIEQIKIGKMIFNFKK